MKTRLLLKLTIVLSLCLAVLLVFTACKDDVIYAGSEDFQSYPEYWNDFNESEDDKGTGDIILPSGDSSGNSETPGEDPNANFTPDDDATSSDSNTSSNTDSNKDSDKDGIPDVEDPDDDNDGTQDDVDPDDDNDGTPDTEEKPDYGNQGPLVFF